jgi:3-oxoacyl-(acyl-carrier-protein) synthase
MLLRSARDAYQDARLESGFFAAEEIGFFVGMGMVDHDLGQIMPAVAHSVDGAGHFDGAAFYSGAYQHIHPLFILSLLNNVSLCQAAIEINIRGENAVFSPHADAGAQAIAEEFERF